MILECGLCNRVKKFGEWKEAPFEFRRLLRELGVEVIQVVCSRCEEGDSSHWRFTENYRIELLPEEKVVRHINHFHWF